MYMLFVFFSPSQCKTSDEGANKLHFLLYISHCKCLNRLGPADCVMLKTGLKDGLVTVVLV